MTLHAAPGPAALPQRVGDPFAEDALGAATTQLGRFLAVLALIDRSVLARAILLEGNAAALTIDVARRRLALLPRHQHGYATDRQLAVTAPKLGRLLGKRVPAAQAAGERLAKERGVLLECAARTLWNLAADGRIRSSVAVASHADMAAGIWFAPLELYRAAAHQFAPHADSRTSDYFRAMRTRALGAWRATHDGWALDWAGSEADPRDQLRTVAGIASTARACSEWLDRAAGGRDPVIGFLSEAGHETIRCITADAGQIAHVALQPSAWAGALQTWDMICATPARKPGSA